MSLAPVIDALALPADARLDQRVPKKLLLEQGAPTVADKHLIQDGIEELTWVAALKPTNIAVPSFRDEARDYLEVAVLTVSLRSAAKLTRLTELIHRAIPYPVVLLAECDEAVNLSLAHKRWSQGEAGKVVLEGLRQLLVNPKSPSPAETAFLASLAIAYLPRRDLFALYEGLLQRLATLEAARISAEFALPESDGSASALQEAVDSYARITSELAILRARAAKEKQINRRVELNLEIKRLEHNLIVAVNSIKRPS